MYMLIAATIFHAYPKETRLRRRTMTFPKHLINIPTPIMAGVELLFVSMLLVFFDLTIS